MKKIIFMVVMGGVLFTPLLAMSGWKIETVDSNAAGRFSYLIGMVIHI